jgi:putative addiction module component (TIGR02574 family)
MNASMDQLLTAALALPDADRVEFVEALLASLQPHDRPPFDESWRPVIERRSKELESGMALSIPWEDVKKHAREHGRV